MRMRRSRASTNRWQGVAARHRLAHRHGRARELSAAAIESGFDAKARARSSALRAIKAALPADGVVFSDMTQIAYFGNYAYPVEHPGQWFHPSGYGTLGFALPAALGAKIAGPGARRHRARRRFRTAIHARASFMTAVEAGLSLPIVVWNNSALGQIRDDMVAAGIPELGVIARNPDFVALAHACGAEALPRARPGRAHRGRDDGARPGRSHLDRGRRLGLR